MVTSTKSVARKASAIAAAALSVTAAPLLGGTAARASTIGYPFLYRSRDTAATVNCTGPNRELSNKGNVNLGRYSIYATASFSSSTVGIWLYSRWQQIAATVADKAAMVPRRPLVLAILRRERFSPRSLAVLHLLRRLPVDR